MASDPVGWEGDEIVHNFLVRRDKGGRMGILSWIVIGLIAGLIAKAIMPGKDPGGFIVTMLLGIAGALLGGWIGSALTGAGLEGFSFWSLLLAVAGSLILLGLYRLATGGSRHRRATI